MRLSGVVLVCISRGFLWFSHLLWYADRMRLLSESRSLGIVVITIILFVFLGSWGPVPSGMRGVHSQNQPSLQPIPEKENFRCIVVGDSQTTDTSAERIRTQSHRWDAPIIGELVCAGSSSTGFLVNNGSFGVQDLLYRNVDLDGGWLDNGPRDFFAQFASEWKFTEDVTAVGARIGRYRFTIRSRQQRSAMARALGYRQQPGCSDRGPYECALHPSVRNACGAWRRRGFFDTQASYPR